MFLASSRTRASSLRWLSAFTVLAFLLSSCICTAPYVSYTIGDDSSPAGRSDAQKGLSDHVSSSKVPHGTPIKGLDTADGSHRASGYTLAKRQAPNAYPPTHGSSRTQGIWQSPPNEPYTGYGPYTLASPPGSPRTEQSISSPATGQTQDRRERDRPEGERQEREGNSAPPHAPMGPVSEQDSQRLTNGPTTVAASSKQQNSCKPFKRFVVPRDGPFRKVDRHDRGGLSLLHRRRGRAWREVYQDELL